MITLHILDSSSVHHQEYFTVHRAMECAVQFCRQFASCQQTRMTYTIAVCTVKNSWWWTEELSKICRVLFQEYIWEISASSWLYYKKFNTIYGHMNVKVIKFNQLWQFCIYICQIYRGCLRSAYTVFMCFVFIWEQTATCATYGINWSVFITETESVYCAVRTGSLKQSALRL